MTTVKQMLNDILPNYNVDLVMVDDVHHTPISIDIATVGNATILNCPCYAHILWNKTINDEVAHIYWIREGGVYNEIC